MQTKLTKLEKYWILYDVGNSAFTLLISTIFPIYFNSLSAAAGVEEVDYLAYWGYATSLATLIVALLGPVLGTVADNRGYKKKLFAGSMGVGIAGLAVLWIPSSWLAFLALFLLARVDVYKRQALDQKIAEKMGFPGCYPVSGQTYSRKNDSRVLNVLAGIAQSLSLIHI